MRRPGLLSLAVVLVCALAAAGGFLAGRTGGPNLTVVQQSGALAGARSGWLAGNAAGHRAGYRAGHDAGYRRAYGPAYQAAYRRALGR